MIWLLAYVAIGLVFGVSMYAEDRRGRRMMHIEHACVCAVLGIVWPIGAGLVVVIITHEAIDRRRDAP